MESVAAKNAVSELDEDEDELEAEVAVVCTLPDDTSVEDEAEDEVFDAAEADFVFEDELVESSVVDTTSFPAVTVTSPPPKAEPPSVKVVVADLAVLVIVPREASIVLLQEPWSESVISQPRLTVPAGSSDAVGWCV
jgi:hypothetical protein